MNFCIFAAKKLKQYLYGNSRKRNHKDKSKGFT